jgi:tRNA dimethylallyltransferase
MIVVVGPTAVGKTNFCIRLAKKLDCEIISADSRQFYKDLSIGTAKPNTAEMSGVKHHFIDFLPIQEEFSAGKFEMAVLALLDKIFNKNNRVIMTGGSGLYIQAVCEGMNEIPHVDSLIRKSLYQELESHGLAPLVEELKVKDPVYFEQVDIRNTQRIIRALEICRGTGNPYSSFRTDQKTSRDFEMIKIGLERSREEIFGRIDNRMDEMIKNGLFEEAERFYSTKHLNALKTVGYREIFGYLDGAYDKNEAIRLLKRNSRRYAKRQLTWFKKDAEFNWFHPDDFDLIIHYITEKLSLHP